MSSTAHAPSPRPRSFSLRRDIIVVLSFKLLALIVLYFLFFDQRPQITPVRVEERMLATPPADGTPHD